MLDQTRIAHKARKALVAEDVIVKPELAPVSRQRFGRRMFADIVIARYVIEFDGRVELDRNSQMLGGLGCLAGLLMRSPQITTKAGRSRLACVIAPSRLAVSCENSPRPITGRTADIWMKKKSDDQPVPGETSLATSASLLIGSFPSLVICKNGAG
jgi:hypothetical protein